MKTIYFLGGVLPLIFASCLTSALAHPFSSPPATESLSWKTVVNNTDPVPGDSAGRLFNSYNPPSVNTAGLVVFRGRSRGPEPPASGIFARDMGAKSAGSLYRIIARGDQVPLPNNTNASFNEFPAFARIAIHNPHIATRGNSEPVWRYTDEDGETRVGTSGVYSAFDGINPATTLSQLGLVPGFSQFLVPGVTPATRFDQFPGAPSPTDNGVVLTKGNYTVDTVRHTGIFYRNVAQGDTSIQLIANSQTTIPDHTSSLTFGSTAPPSAADDKVVFVAYDNEETPQYGGIYLADIQPSPRLKTLITVGAAVPGEPGAHFTRFGEALSFDGRHVTFWGTWGDEFYTLRLHCPTEGNRQRVIYCRDIDPNTNRDSDERWQEKPVPVHQGIFLLDTVTDQLRLIARSGEDYNDFLYWNYSGHPPGSGDGEGDAEPPRWRSAAFIAVSGNGNAKGHGANVVYKARTGEIDSNSRRYESYIDGLYLQRSNGRFPATTLVDTTMAAGTLDDEAPPGTTISALGLERDGLRGRYLAVSASGEETEEAEEETSWAGIFVVELPPRLGRAGVRKH